MRRTRTTALAALATGCLAVPPLVAALPSAAAGARVGDAQLVRCTVPDGPTATTRARELAAASRAAGVPLAVLKAVSYLESRWDDHAGSPSTSGGYGPMHLVPGSSAVEDGRGDDSRTETVTATDTLALGSRLTGAPAEQLRTDPGANVCGGAAVLASMQEALGGPVGTGTSLHAWGDAVAQYAASSDPAASARFVRDVYGVLREGAARTTVDGQRVSLAAHPQVATPPAGVPAPTTSARPGDGESDPRTDCPRSLGCEWIPAPYEWYGAPDPGAYGNHDLADRPRDLSIDTIIIHDTEASWQTTLDLVTNPRYVSWQYSLRSSDGHIAQHVDLDDVAWHAGNWYMNMHSIGLEHEGFAAQGASWYTEAMYRTSATLVRHLTKEYDIPRDRAHVIGHDQIPGTTAATVRGMHWDPGPYWDWEHYMELLRAPIGGPGQGKGRDIRAGDVVTVRPGFQGNEQPLTGCTRAGVPCEPQGTNFVYLHTAPDESSPLVTDRGLRPDGAPSTTQVSDIGARAAAGQQLVVDRLDGDWLGVWWLGELAWLHSPAKAPTVVRDKGRQLTVSPAAVATGAPVYGRAYPEESAYPAQIPYQTVSPLQYTIGAGQSYVVADADVPTDYYYAKTYDDSLPMDHTVVRGQDRYLQVWLGHRLAYVRAVDVVMAAR